MLGEGTKREKWKETGGGEGKGREMEAGYF